MFSGINGNFFISVSFWAFVKVLCFSSLADSLLLYFMHALSALKFSDSHRHSPSALFRVPGFKLMSFLAALDMDLFRSSFVAFARLFIPYMKSGDFLSISMFCDSSMILSSAAVSSLSFLTYSLSLIHI